MRLLRLFFQFFCRFIADNPSARWIVENEADIARSGLAGAQSENRVAIVGGAGVNQDIFSASEMPGVPPLRAAFVARLIWSKGLDVAVEAVSLARRRGADVTLTIAGAADPGNPRAYSGAALEKFAATPGVNFLGPVEDVPALWRDHHLAILPSRGGEGVPKSLIEAASCARPILTTNVPGCKELADLTNGWTFPVDDVQAAAELLCKIAAMKEELGLRGKSARLAVEGYSEESVWRSIKKFYE